MLTKILIADSCDEFRLVLADRLSGRYRVHACPDGTQALEQLDSFCPDLLVVDLVLQGVDGLGVIQALRKRSECVPIVVASSVHPAYAANQLAALQVDYIGIKPCSTDYLLERIEELASNICVPFVPAESAYGTVTAALLEIGMTTGRAGFLYIRDAILMLADNPNLRMTKDIYPEIARIYNTSAMAVEKDIRDIIAATWCHGDPGLLRRYFIPAPNGKIPRPSNKVFLSNLAERLFSVNRLAK